MVCTIELHMPNIIITFDSLYYKLFLLLAQCNNCDLSYPCRNVAVKYYVTHWICLVFHSWFFSVELHIQFHGTENLSFPIMGVGGREGAKYC